jgi:hypothetical protein
VRELQSILAACQAQAAACKPEIVGPDETVTGIDGFTTRVRYEWLRAGIRKLAATPGPSRDALGAELSQRFASQISGGTPVDPDLVAQAQTGIQQVLSTPEFAPAPPPNWLERQWIKLRDWILQLLSRGFEAAASGPAWLRVAFEVLIVLVPVLLLLLWLMRQVREERFRPGEARRTNASRGSGSEIDWLESAARHARAREWRHAIHAVYWATIVQFEAKENWAVNRTRTPREYLRLLEPGTHTTTLLREETRLLESTWYGYRDATAKDYENAQRLHRELTIQ